jgi:hypothetical protein
MQGESGTKTAAPHSQQSCVGCPLEAGQVCRHTPGGLVDFGLLAVGFFIPFVAGMMLSGYWLALGLWLLLAGAFFGYVEALVLCRHCPHYAGARLTLGCHADYGLARVPGFSPRPLTQREKIVFLSYTAVLGLYYLPFLVAGHQWLLLFIATGALATWFYILLRTQCTRCCHVFCPANRVPPEVREEVFEHCTVLAGARSLSQGWLDQKLRGGGCSEGR